MQFSVLTYLHRFAIFHIGFAWWAWVLLFFGDEFSYYWFQRASHECRIFGNPAWRHEERPPQVLGRGNPPKPRACSGPPFGTFGLRNGIQPASEVGMNKDLILALLDEGYSKKTWHGPNLRQSLKGVTVKQAAWRPSSRRHNIWELALHAAYWKYAVRRRLEGDKRGSFVLKGSNFFPRPETGKATEAAWRADQRLLEKEHRAMVATIGKVLRSPAAKKKLAMLYGVAFHDVYHAGQIRLLRRLQER